MTQTWMMECIFTERNCIITESSLQISNQFPDQNIIEEKGQAARGGGTIQNLFKKPKIKKSK